MQPIPIHILTMAVVCLQSSDFTKAKYYLDQLEASDLEQRSYLYYGTLSDYEFATKNIEKAVENIDLALQTVTNSLEKEHLQKKRAILITS